MPYTFNGIGTWYWGKRNAQSRMGACESCGRFGELKSYDTTLYFVVLFLPLIPLGRKRIVDECSVCRRHRVVGLRQYREAQNRDLTDAIKAMKEAPQDAAKTAAALKCMLAYQDRRAFGTLAEAVPRLFPRDADLLALAAEGCMFFGENAKAEGIWRLALQARDSAEFRQRMALSILRQLRPRDAEPLLAHITADGDREAAGHLYLLVAGYQATAEHRKALDVLDRIAATWPEMAKDKEYKKYRKTSERRKDGGKAVRSALLAEPKTRGEGPDATGRLARIFVPAAVAALAAAYLAWCYAAGQSRPVWLVNGTARAYPVLVNGREFELAAGEHRPISLAEGAWLIEPRAGAGEQIEPDRVVFRRPFLARPFDRATLVLNPDRTAILLEESTVYSAQPDPGARHSYSLHCGRTFHEFKGIDYPFIEFPASINMNSSSALVTKRRLGTLQPMPPGALIPLLRNELGDEACAQYLARRAGYEPEEGIWLFSFVSLAPPDKALELVRTRLARRPVLVEWHRAYQILMEQRQPEHDLAAEYKPLVQQEPNDPYLRYLLGRVTKPAEEAEKLFAEAEQCGGAPIGYGYHAVAYARLCDGLFAEAADLARKALAARPAALQFEALWETAAEGAGRFDELLAAAEAGRRKEPASLSLLMKEYGWLCAMGRAADAEERFGNYERAYAGAASAETMKQMRAILLATAAYLDGRLDEYAQIADRMPEPRWKFAAAITRFDPAGAAEHIAGMEHAGYPDHLLLYAAARANHDEELAKRHWESAFALIGNIVGIDKEAVKVLTAGEKIDPEALLGVMILPDEKRLLLMAFGLAYPEHRKALFAQAKRLNTSVGFPRAFVDKVVSGEK